MRVHERLRDIYRMPRLPRVRISKRFEIPAKEVVVAGGGRGFPTKNAPAHQENGAGLADWQA